MSNFSAGQHLPCAPTAQWKLPLPAIAGSVCKMWYPSALFLPCHFWIVASHMEEGSLQMWLRILRWEYYPGIFTETPCNHKGPYGREEESQRNIQWQKHRWEQWGLWDKKCRWPLEGVKSKETTCPYSLQRNIVLPTHGCSPIKLILDFQLPELWGSKFEHHIWSF
jgi:hypothetical protein